MGLPAGDGPKRVRSHNVGTLLSLKLLEGRGCGVFANQPQLIYNT